MKEYTKCTRSFGAEIYSQWANLYLTLEHASDVSLTGLIEAMILLGFNTEDSICELAHRMGGDRVMDRIHGLLARHEQQSIGPKLWHRCCDGHFTLVDDRG